VSSSSQDRKQLRQLLVTGCLLFCEHELLVGK